MSAQSGAAAVSFIEQFMEALAPFTVVIIIWGVIALGFLIWYLWAMARLFPRLGLSGGQGWIPIWNEWKLIDRIGLPGWTALLYFVGLGIVPLILRTMAQHRIGRELGLGGGYTVLGFFLAPLWATLMGSLLEGQVLGDTRLASWPQAAGQGSGVHGFGAQGSGVPGAAPQGAATMSAAPGVPSFGVQTSSSPARTNPYAPPQSAQATQAAQASPTSAAPLWAGQQPGSAPTPFTAETEAEYARLASEAFMAPPAAPLGQPVAPEPFSWTAASRSVEPDPVKPVAAPPIHPISAAAAPPVTPPARPTPPPPVLPARPQDPSATPAATTSGGNIPLPPGDQTRTKAVEQGAAKPVSAPESSSGITANYNPLPPVTRLDRGIAADDDDLDKTVVVNRKPALTWSLVLPDGEALALSADTVVGRRPDAPTGAVALQIADPTRTLSKNHARFRLDGDTWTVEDLQSTNGVFLIADDGSERELEAGTPEAVEGRLMLGTLEVRLRRSDHTEA